MRVRVAIRAIEAFNYFFGALIRCAVFTVGDGVDSFFRKAFR